MYNKTMFLFYIVVSFPGIVFCQQGSAQNFDSIKLVKPGAALIQVSKQFSFTEGPAVDKKGNIFFTD